MHITGRPLFHVLEAGCALPLSLALSTFKLQLSTSISHSAAAKIVGNLGVGKLGKLEFLVYGMEAILSAITPTQSYLSLTLAVL